MQQDLYGGAEELLAESLTWEQALDHLIPSPDELGERLSARTRTEYRADISQLAEFLKEQGITNPRETTLIHLEQFLALCQRRKYTVSTKRRKISSIKTFFGLLTRNGPESTNPAERLILPERKDKDIRYLTVIETRKLLAACADNTRDAVIIEILLKTGIRLSEIVTLTTNDVQLAEYTHGTTTSNDKLIIRGKGHRARILPLDFEARQSIKRWLNKCDSVSQNALFVTHKGEPMGRRAFQDVVSKYFKLTNISNASLKSLRHTFAVNYLIRNQDLHSLRNVMGFAHVADTYHYLEYVRQGIHNHLE